MDIVSRRHIWSNKWSQHKLIQLIKSSGPAGQHPPGTSFSVDWVACAQKKHWIAGAICGPSPHGATAPGPPLWSDFKAQDTSGLQEWLSPEVWLCPLFSPSQSHDLISKSFQGSLGFVFFFYSTVYAGIWGGKEQGVWRSSHCHWYALWEFKDHFGL